MEPKNPWETDPRNEADLIFDSLSPPKQMTPISERLTQIETRQLQIENLLKRNQSQSKSEISQILRVLEEKANADDVHSGFQKMSAFIKKLSAGSSLTKKEELNSLNNANSLPKVSKNFEKSAFENPEELSALGKYEIIKSLEAAVKDSERKQNETLGSYLKKFDFYQFCDKFADFTNSYEKMKAQMQDSISEIYLKITAEVLFF